MPPKRGLTPAGIADEAVLLAEERGLDGITVQALADRLGVKPASLYNHVDGLGDILRSVSRLSMLQLEAAIRDAAVGLSGGTALKGVALAYRAFAHSHPELYKAYIRSASLEDPELEEAGRSIARVMHRVVLPTLGEMDASVHFVRGFRSAMHGFVSLEEAGFFHGKADVEQSFRQMTDRLANALDEYTAQGV